MLDFYIDFAKKKMITYKEKVYLSCSIICKKKKTWGNLSKNSLNSDQGRILSEKIK